MGKLPQGMSVTVAEVASKTRRVNNPRTGGL